MNEQQKRQAIFITVLSVILIIVIALVVYFFKKSQDTGNGVVLNPPMSEDPLYKKATESLKKDYSFDRNTEASRDWTDEDLQKMGMAFAERLGSYSSDSNYANLLDLKLFMSPEMSDWADSYVKTLQANRDKDSQYYGISTIAVSGEITSFDNEAGTAVGQISTQRNELRGSNSNTFIQKLNIEFTKINNEWKVSSASWVK